MVMLYQKFGPRPGVMLAYRRFSGQSKTLPGVVFLGGFMSDMQGRKAAFLEERCEQRQQSYLRFDYQGHGLSSGTFQEATIGSRLQDAVDIIDSLTSGPQVVVGSSMGGWIMLLLALKRPQRVAGLVGIAPAPDFSEDVYKHVFTEEHRRHLEKTGLVYLPNDTEKPYPLTKHLFEEARNHLLLDGKIAINAPVRLIHGKQDTEVPWRKSEKIRAQLASPDVKITWVEDGDHRLSRDEDLKLIDEAVVELSHQHQMKLAAQA
jgi:pimeloyl-ACP methyl ester carboxylesterase